MTVPESMALLVTARQALADQALATLVTVSATRGSAPRLAGAAMLVTPYAVTGTIGGGHLELQAIALARCRVAMSLENQRAMTQAIEYPLGAALGQCCGGAMTLRYEALQTQHLQRLQDQVSAYKTLYLFGAGHVAQSLVPLLAGLPLRVVWGDSRDTINTYQTPFPASLPAHISTVLSDTLEAELLAAQAGDMVLIMSHSHALDESLLQAALRLPQLAYIGLIGSATKRRLFEQRLAQRGFAPLQLQRFVCPIGVASQTTAHSKLPAVIAVQVAAQLTHYL